MRVSTAVSGPRVEQSLVRRAQAGDATAFTALLREYDDGLRGLAFRLLGDRDRLDDVLQEAYLKAFRALKGFRGEASPATWLYRIVYNACLDDLRRRRVDPLGPAELADLGPAVEEESGAVLERDRIARALARLPLPQRAAVLLVDVHGFDYAEAGHALGVPEGTIASRLSSARAALRRELDERQEIDR